MPVDIVENGSEKESNDATQVQPSTINSSDDRQRCAICITKKKQTRLKCSICKKPACAEHSTPEKTVICTICNAGGQGGN